MIEKSSKNQLQKLRVLFFAIEQPRFRLISTQQCKKGSIIRGFEIAKLRKKLQWSMGTYFR